MAAVIASFSRSFVFIKTHKTGGTSAELVLSSWCLPGDVCTPLSAEDEPLRAELGSLAPTSWAPTASLRDQRAAGRPLPAAALCLLRNRRLFNHMSAAAVRSLFPALWESGRTFTVERHPYEKAVSRAYFGLGRGAAAPQVASDPVTEPAAASALSDRIDRVIASGGLSDKDLYLIDGVIGVDEVIAYERLWERLGELGAGWGMTLPDRLPQAKSRYRTDRRPARDLLTADQRRDIQAQMAFEFETFGFET